MRRFLLKQNEGLTKVRRGNRSGAKIAWCLYRTIIALFLLLPGQLSFAQVSESWKKTLPNIYSYSYYSDQGASVLDDEGNMYVVGFNQNQSYAPALIQKFNASGELIWERTYSKKINNYDTSHQPRGIKLNADGSIVVVCYSYYYGNNTNGSRTSILKYDKSGNNIFQIEFIPTTSVTSFGMGPWSVDSKGNIIVSGTDYVNSNYKTIVAKFDPSGNKQWEKVVSSGSYTQMAFLKVDNLGNSYVVDQNNSAYTIRKLDTSGEIIWSKTISTPANYTSSSIVDFVLDASQNVYLASQVSNNSSYAVYLTKLGSDATTAWTKFYNGNSPYVWPYRISLDNSNNIVVLGRDNNTDMFTIKYSNSGELLWEVKTSGSSSDESGKYLYPTGIKIANSDNIYIIGSSIYYSSSNQYDVLIKFDSNGKEKWRYNISRDYYDDIMMMMSPNNDILVDKGESVYLRSANGYSSTGSQISKYIQSFSVSLTSVQKTITNENPIAITIEFDNSVTGFSLEDLVAENAEVKDLQGSGSTYTVNLIPSGDGVVKLKVKPNSVTDANNYGNAEGLYSIAFDKTAPAIPSGLAVTSGDTRNVISWTANAEADFLSYSLYAIGSDKKSTLIASIPAGTTTYTQESLTNGSQYLYSISATDKVGNESGLAETVSGTPKGMQTITFNPIEAKNYGSEDFSPGATSSSGLTVSYASDNSAVATIVDNKIHIVGVGKVNITSTQSGNEVFTAATEVKQSFTVLAPLNPPSASTLSFNGSNQYVSIPNNPELEFTEGTIEMWVKPTWVAGSATGNPTVIGERNTTGSRYSFHINNQLDRIGLWNGSSYNSITYAFTKDKWYHLAFVMKSTNTEIFVNGVSIGFTGNAINAAKKGLSINMGIAEYSTANYFEIFKGEMDEVRIWKTARTASEIAANLPNTIDPASSNLIAYYSIESNVTAESNQLARAFNDNSSNKFTGKLYNYWAPVVTTNGITGIQTTSAILGGTVVSEEDPLNEYGIVYSATNTNPTTADSKLSIGKGIADYSSTVSSLAANTSYNVRAYAKNAVGTSYGEAKSFRTLNTVATLANLASSKGSISPDFNAAILNYVTDVDYSTSSIVVTPTLSDANATVKVNGVKVENATASSAINLAVGINTILIAVTAEDGLTLKTYSIKVNRRNSQTIAFDANSTKTYGDADFVAGAVASSGLAVNYTSSNTSVATIVNGKVHVVSAGTTVITASQAGNTEYDPASSKEQSLTVNKKALTVTADNKSKTYGEANPALSVTYSGLVNGETILNPAPSVSTTATAASSVGAYDITASGTASNYDVTFVKGTLTVAKKALTVTAENKAKTYGDTNPALSVTYSGLVNGETALNPAPAVSTTATTQSGIGTYDITASGASANYTVTYVKGTLTVGRKVLTITAENKEKFQGLALPAFTAAYSGFVNGETSSVLTTQPAFSTTATANSAQGTYPITVNGATAANYAISFVPGVLTVKPGYPTSITLAASTLYENAPVSTVAGTLSSTSDDPSATFTYSLVSGTGSTDNASFKISGNQIQTN
ncbi:MBG domain-containing protein, partial [Desertivirga arenae]|uniref:MBG domain-containing protein n=1 Tax=Desertivirga arenae TaxID=2810309 RepID=UPI001A957199